MRMLCDVCETAAAILFCAADEAALCRACDDKVHKCNKLASRHVRVGLAAPSDVPVCDICENAPAFFYCEVDGTCLCLQCDMIVHVGGKRTHKRFLLLRQIVEFPGDNPNGTAETATKPMDLVGNEAETTAKPMDLGGNKADRYQTSRRQSSGEDNQVNQEVPSLPIGNDDEHAMKKTKKDTKMMIDLNLKPYRLHGQPSDYQEL